MNVDEPTSAHPVDRLVRAALDADASDVDVARLERAIEAQLAAEALIPAAVQLPSAQFQTPTRRLFLRSGVAAAACLATAGGLAGYLLLTPTKANAFSLVQSAQLALAEVADRCYRVEMDAPKSWPFLRMDSSTLLWTRGDRYRVEMDRGGEPLVWGQDEKQRIWMVYSPDRGLLFETRDLPPSVHQSLSYLRLDVRRLTGAMLQDCDLKFPSDKPVRRGDAVATIAATVKHGRKSFQFEAATLDIDLLTKAVRRLELRLRNGSEDGRIQFTFVEETPQSDDSYRLASHLLPDATILGRSRRAERQKLAMQLIVRSRLKSPVKAVQ
jgi:hypothetical protein